MDSGKEGNGAATKRTTLHDLYELQGQSPWYDNLCRPVTDLLPYIANGVRGVTSNPTVIIRCPFYFSLRCLVSTMFPADCIPHDNADFRESYLFIQRVR